MRTVEDSLNFPKLVAREFAWVRGVDKDSIDLMGGKLEILGDGLMGCVV